MDTKDRRTGRTTRIILKALLYASDNKDSTVYVVEPTEALASVIFRRLRDFGSHIHGCISTADRTFKLPNDSVVKVVGRNYYNENPGLFGHAVYFDEL
jgi:Rad3-related DNA helicase